MPTDTTIIARRAPRPAVHLAAATGGPVTYGADGFQFDQLTCPDRPQRNPDRAYWERGFHTYVVRHREGMKRRDPMLAEMVAERRYRIKRARVQFAAGWNAAAAIEDRADPGRRQEGQ